MSKYCMSCGKQNEDQAAFCVACGVALPEVKQGPPAGPPAESVTSQPPFASFLAEMGPGEHEHVSSDISLKDDKGVVVYTVKRPSLLHERFEIVDSQGQTKGRVNRKMHLSHTSFEICDPDGKVLNVFNIKQHAIVNGRRRPPDCWLEDVSKNTQGKIEWVEGFFNFGLMKPDGMEIFGVRTATEGGVLQRLRELGSRRYAIDLFDPAFSVLILAGTIAAFDVGTM